MSSSVAFYQGKAYYAYVDQQGRVCVNGGTVDPNSKARSGAGIAIDQDSGKKTVSYTAESTGQICIYEQQPGSTNWGWANKGWPAK